MSVTHDLHKGYGISSRSSSKKTLTPAKANGGTKAALSSESTAPQPDHSAPKSTKAKGAAGAESKVAVPATKAVPEASRSTGGLPCPCGGEAAVMEGKRECGKCGARVVFLVQKPEPIPPPSRATIVGLSGPGGDGLLIDADGNGVFETGAVDFDGDGEADELFYDRDQDGSVDLRFANRTALRHGMASADQARTASKSSTPVHSSGKTAATASSSTKPKIIIHTKGKSTPSTETTTERSKGASGAMWVVRDPVALPRSQFM